MKNKFNDLQTIPGVGPCIAKDFWNIGIKNVSDLHNKNPEKLYIQICDYQGVKVDRCLLYVCRAAVYFAKTKNPETEKSKWWNWKD